MIKFLISRPIAVTTSLVTIIILGIVSLYFIPISLMPDIDVPVVTIKVSQRNLSAREIENTVIYPLRSQLNQITHLVDLKSESQNENAVITLTFEYGADIDLSFIEVNERIDRAMSSLPRNLARPKAIKSSVTDIPIFYLNVTNKDIKTESNEALKDDESYRSSEKFRELSEFSSKVIRKRLEQLPEVAMADISGAVYSEIAIHPDILKLKNLGISMIDLEDAILSNNVDFGTLTVNNGPYQYSLKLRSPLNSKEEIEEIFLNVRGTVFKLKELAKVVEAPREQRGVVIFNDKRALTLAIIKRSDAQTYKLRKTLHDLVKQFERDYPNIEFIINRDQTELLEYSISNLGQDLVWGSILAILVIFLFTKNIRSSILITIVMPISILAAIVMFYLFHVSINIISLSGLVLSVGMMIDNSIIVVDNIIQYQERGLSIINACSKGAIEVFPPMLSSALTTCAVFLPLVFVSGIAGSLFYDEAIAVTIGAFVSLALSLTIIPVYFYLFNKNRSVKGGIIYKESKIELLYEKSINFVFRHQKITWSLVGLIILLGAIAYIRIPKTKLPELQKKEVVIRIAWNDQVSFNENKKRASELTKIARPFYHEYMALIGKQDFILEKKQSTSSDLLFYFKTEDQDNLIKLKNELERFCRINYEKYSFAFEDAQDVFNLIFNDSEPSLTINLKPSEKLDQLNIKELRNHIALIKKEFPEIDLGEVSWEDYVVLKSDPHKLSVYKIPYNVFSETIKTAFSEHQVLLLSQSEESLPIVFKGTRKNIYETLEGVLVNNTEGVSYPINTFIYQDSETDLKTIYSNDVGEYYPLSTNANHQIEELTHKVRSIVNNRDKYSVEFTGSFFSNQLIFKELSVILLLSVVILYLILASQFESLLLPIIILIEIPISVAGAFLTLLVFDVGLNLMSCTGLIVMGGIIINDSILKITTIHGLRKSGYPLIKAIKEGGRRRLQSILMTSLTTTLAMVPLLLTPGLGAELQKPLTFAIIGGMFFGTIVSLYVIPLTYYYSERLVAK